MTPKQYLRQIQKLDIKIQHKKAELLELEALDGLKAVELNGDKVQASQSGDAPFVRTVERISELEQEIDELLVQYVNAKDRIINEIDSLPDAVHIEILHKYYVEYSKYHKLEDVAKAMHYSYPHIKTLHGHALQMFGIYVLKNHHTQSYF